MARMVVQVMKDLGKFERKVSNKKTETMTRRKDFLLGLANIFLCSLIGPDIVQTLYFLTTASISASSLSLREAHI